MAVVALIGTLDTKDAECAWLAEQLDKHGVQALLVGVGSFSAGPLASVSSDDMIATADSDATALHERRDQGEMMQVMSAGAARIVRDLTVSGRVHGLLALGGSGGSSIVTTTMQTLPVGFPRLLASTMASDDVKPYIGEVDATLMYSVVDVAGVNSVSSQVLTNTAAAIAGIAQTYGDRLAAAPASYKPVVVATMSGVTAPVVDEARDTLTDPGYKVLVFRATGAGGRVMEKLAESGLLVGTYDLITTELTDDLVGGVLSAGPWRLEMAGRVGLSQAVSLGAFNTVNFSPVDTVPPEFAERDLSVHNSAVMLMRTAPEEMAELGRRIAVKLAAATGSTELFIPPRGMSTVDVEKTPFQDAEVDAVLFAELRAGLTGSDVVVHELDQAISDPDFGAAMACTLHASITN